MQSQPVKRGDSSVNSDSSDADSSAASSEAPSKGTLAARLHSARRRRFVGRNDELELFRTALQAAEAPFAVLHVYGPGGVGKTTLLSELARIAIEVGVTPLQLDARNLDPSPDGFLAALGGALGLGFGADPVAALHHDPRRAVIVVDTFEVLTPLDAWLRERLLPELPSNALVVLAGRNPPSEGWRADPGWRDLVRTISLRNLAPDESRDYLTRRGIPEGTIEGLLEFTHGHPLALSLVADVLEQRREASEVVFRPDFEPDIIKTLLERFVEKVPSPAHRAALEACALVRVTTEALLAETLAIPDAHELFGWLRGLSFVQSGPQGLFPHDLAREALCADLRWRNRDWYATLHSRARGYYTRRLSETRGFEQTRILFDDVYLHRENPMVKPFLTWGEFGSVFAERGKPEDHPAALELIRKHEGEASTRIAAHWFARQPQGLTVYRDANEGLAGVLYSISLTDTAPDDLEQDPAARAAHQYAMRHAPPREGEEVTFFRFWLGRDVYQGVSNAQSTIFLNVFQHYLTNTRLARSFFVCADWEFWQPAFTYMDLHLAPEAAFETDGKRYGVFTHDWRAVPVTAVLELLGEREMMTEPLESSPPAPATSIVVLSQADFEEAVRAALKDFTRPANLNRNPLLRSRLIQERSNGEHGNAVGALRKLVWTTAQELEANPKDEKLYKALERTYLEPAATQELAAELLDLPFSTYRRHLTTGVNRMIERLWALEVQAS